MSNYKDVLSRDLLELYDVHDFQHAAAILSVDFKAELEEVTNALVQFRFQEQWIKDPGGNESQVPKAFSAILRPLGWLEAGLEAKLVVTEKLRKGKGKAAVQVVTTEVTPPDEVEVVYGTHNIDYVKGKVALDLEWNSKDQTFDRDLYAFRAFFEYRKVDVGIIVTRSNDLDAYFSSLGKYIDTNGKERMYKDKYGATTTHIKKLLPRIQAGRHGGCPLLVFGITRRLLAE